MPIVKNNELPLSFSERRLWFMQNLAPGNAFYNIIVPVKFGEPIDLEVLQKAVNTISERHDVLRTSYCNHYGEPIRVVNKGAKIQVQVISSEEGRGKNRDDLIVHLGKVAAGSGFDPQQAPLARAVVVKLDDGSSILYFVLHHMITDQWSVNILLRELDHIYTAFLQNKAISLPQLPLQYSDFALAQKSWLKTDAAQAQLKYWLNQLQGAKPLFPFPTDYTRSTEPTYAGATALFDLDITMVPLIKKLAAQAGATPAMIFLSLWKLLIFRYSSISDVIVGATMAARSFPGTENILGCFVNILIMRTKVEGGINFLELVRRVKETSVAAYMNSETSYEYIIEQLNPERSGDYMPFSNVYFQFQSAVLRKNLDSTVLFRQVKGNRATFDIMLNISETTEGGFAGYIEYTTDLFHPETIGRLINHLKILLTDAVRNTEKPISRLEMLSYEEKIQFMRWNTTSRCYPDNQCVQHLIEESVLKNRSKSAVIVGNLSLTYHELNQRSNQLAHYLIRMGVKANMVVGVLLNRDECLPIILLAILKAGGAYMPLDCSYPSNRLKIMLENSKVSILITKETLLDKIPVCNFMKTLCFDEIQALLKIEKGTNPIIPPQPSSLAYVIHTSGTTGEPMAVGIEHKSVVSFLSWAGKQYRLEELSCVLASTSISFDLSVFELFLPLSVGGAVLIVDNISQRCQWENKPISLINTVPSLQSRLLHENVVLPDSVKVVNLAGEILSKELVDKIYSTSVEKVYNLYGPSEATIYSTCKLVPRHEENHPNIGGPIDNIQVYILDDALQQLPVGVAGNLYLGGVALARMYLNDPLITDQRFITNPFVDIPGERLYNTGDRCRFLAGGDIEFIGRNDSQIKIRGFRVELEEIEFQLLKHPDVKEAKVLFYHHEERSQIIAFIVSKNKEEQPGLLDLQSFLCKSLPRYMLPSNFISLKNLPRGISGKIDVEVLWRLYHEEQTSQEIRWVTSDNNSADLNEVKKQKTLSRIWRKTLNINRISIDDNFFKISGDSITNIYITALANSENIRLEVKDVFQYQTVAELVKVAISRE